MEHIVPGPVPHGTSYTALQRSHTVPCDRQRTRDVIICVTDSPTYCDAVLSTMLSFIPPGGAVGFDTETRPVFEKNAPRRPPSVIQIATADYCLVYQTRKITNGDSVSLPTSIVNLFANRSITKAATGVVNDLRNLRSAWTSNLVLESFMEVDQENVRAGLRPRGIKQLMKDCFNADMSKPKAITLSNWGAETLTPEQIQYAAADAWLSLQAYRSVRSTAASHAPVVGSAHAAIAEQGNPREADDDNASRNSRQGRAQNGNGRRTNSNSGRSTPTHRGQPRGRLTVDNVESLVSRIEGDPEAGRDLLLEEIKSPLQWFYFGCQANHIHWWRRVPVRKPVSRCKKCHCKFDPIPKDEWIGHGIFNCPCGKVWTNGASRAITEQPCYGCGKTSLPVRIVPSPRKSERKTQNRHKCAECRGDGSCPVREAARRVDSGPWSSEHASTGSTEASATFEQTLFGVPIADDQMLQNMFGNLLRISE